MVEVNDLVNIQHSTNKNIRFKTPMLRSDLCDNSHPYIVLKEKINLKTDNVMKRCYTKT